MATKRKRLKSRKDYELTLKELAEEFIDEKKADGRAAKTIESYEGSFRKFLNNFGEELTLKDIDRGTIIQYKNHMKKEELSVSATNHYLRDMRTLFNWLHDLNYLEKIEVKMVKPELFTAF